MPQRISRREFDGTMFVATGATSFLQGQTGSRRRLKIGHTEITWGFKPEDAERAVKGVGTAGYWGYERSATCSKHGAERRLAAAPRGQ